MSQFNHSDREQMTSVSKDSPCAVCGGDHKCSWGDGGLLICGRRSGPVPGFRHLGPSKGDEQFHLYRRDDGTGAGAEKPNPKPKTKPPKDWGAVASQFAMAFSREAQEELSQRLGLPSAVFATILLIGVIARSLAGRTFTFPECDATGKVLGITERIPEEGGKETKKMLAGGKRGLTIPHGWKDREGPVCLVEGPSDTLAMTAADLAALGRPSNTGGIDHLVAILAPLPAHRPIFVIGENDRRADGLWPGCDGAHRTALALQRRLDRPVMVAMPPLGSKDVRQWLVGRTQQGGDWATLGSELLAHFEAVAVPPRGAGRPQIIINPEEHAVNDAAVAALPAAEGVYQRGGILCHILRLEAPTETQAVRQPAGATVVRELSPPLLREQLTRVADWLKMEESEGECEPVPAHPPAWCVQAVHARGEWPGVRRLEAVVTHPIRCAMGRCWQSMATIDRPEFSYRCRADRG